MDEQGNRSRGACVSSMNKIREFLKQTKTDTRTMLGQGQRGGGRLWGRKRW